ncbi:GNAT family N-acetyltransferase [Limnohabitans sp. DM1]|uniref:GNAT family N-acetyltransferase n=1 Tax=Limnohabitans sp. DM1 TaxID=1597955 RepID=UPI000AD67188|nr:GNAT family protein [Limnohabitans sp. DM1]
MNTEITLRPVQLNDIDDEYCSWYVNSDGHLNYFTGSGRTFSRELLVKDFKEGIESQRWYYHCILNEAGQKIGNVKIGPFDLRNKTSDLVCLIGNRTYLGKGLASQAIMLANQVAFNHYDIRRLQGGMYASNISSIKAYTKAGWFIEATMKGFYWVNDQPEDRICVACLNPRYFS